MRSIETIGSRQHRFRFVHHDLGHFGPGGHSAGSRNRGNHFQWIDHPSWRLDNHQDDGDYDDEEEQRIHARPEHHRARPRASVSSPHTAYRELDTPAVIVKRP
jgi:hypothetical protein